MRMNSKTFRALNRKKQLSDAVVKLVVANKLLNKRDTEFVEIRETLKLSRQNFNYYLNDMDFMNQIKSHGIKDYKGIYKRYFYIPEDVLKRKIKLNK